MLQKEAATSPDPARQPPTKMIGRLPNLFTRMLLIGPVEKEEKKSWCHIKHRHIIANKTQAVL